MLSGSKTKISVRRAERSVGGRGLPLEGPIHYSYLFMSVQEMSTAAGTLMHALPSTHKLDNRTCAGWIMPCCATSQATPLPIRRREVTSRCSDIFQIRPCYFHGVAYTGLVKSPFTTNRDCTSLDVISSDKAHGQLHRTKDLDNDDNILTEEDLNYKPMGFGQGKTYDTSLEDQLLEKIERIKAAALPNQETNPVSKKPKPKSKLEHSTTISGIKVWVGDLPKKRNIDRDLRSAFRHIPGLLDISPSVVGNEKTRDPICKGFGFLTFDTLDHAKSFVSSFQGQPISFGKVQKQLSFSITKASCAEAISSGSKSSFEASKLRVRDKGAGIVAGSGTKPELGSPRIVEQGAAVGPTQEREPTQLFQPEVEVIQNEAEVGSFEENDEFPGEESEDESDLDDEPEIEVTVEIGDPPSAAFINRPQGVEDQKLSEAERHIEELEERLRKKLEAGRLESQKKREKQMTKPRGFNSRKSSPKGNNLAAVTHGLKKREREVMTGVLDKYGRGPSPTKP